MASGLSLRITPLDMRISGFTFVRNANKLFIPAVEAITSILPLVDEFVVAVGASEDDTRALIASIPSDKIKIIDTTWETENYPRNTVFARETDKAKTRCTGDWLFYIQCDEVLHEQYLPAVRQAMEKYFHDTEVEGLLFRYKHFWGDFNHFNHSHVFYDYEIRVVRNLPEIHSWKDAQSFRKFDTFDGSFDAYESKGGEKLKVVKIPAEIYHYGWVRPPEMMMKKSKVASESYRGAEATAAKFSKYAQTFDYGPLGTLPEFTGTHPKVMAGWLTRFDWADQLNYGKKFPKVAHPEKHERLKYRWLTWIENRLLGGRRIGAFKNYELLRR
jgi:hypothetical protein